MLNVFFDVDYTILGIDGSLRPGTMDAFKSIKKQGHNIYIWSGVGVRTYEVSKHGLESLVCGVFRKPLENFNVEIKKIGIPVIPDFVIDDYPEIVAEFGGIHIKPYYYKSQPDDYMLQVPQVIFDYSSKGESDHPDFRLKVI